MKITYKCSDEIFEGVVVYNKRENSFDFISDKHGDISLLINYLQLTIDSRTHQLVSIWGLHPYHSWIIETLDVPQIKKGIVEIENNYVSGISYREEYMNEWKTFYDNTSGWVCIGDKDMCDLCIMFANNIGVVVKDNHIKSLWIKPKFI